MRLLLDTHSFLWFIAGDAKLSATAQALIEDPANERLLSVASIWEMAIKFSLGHLQLAQPFHLLIPHELMHNDMTLLPITTTRVEKATAREGQALTGGDSNGVFGPTGCSLFSSQRSVRSR